MNMKTILCNPGNYQTIRRKESDIHYIVIHYTGNNGDTAKGNGNYFRENVVKASAHFFVDENEIICSVPWYFVAWHCGTKGEYLHPSCRNKNSIGIELCSQFDQTKGYYFLPETIERAAKFTALQMKIYGLDIRRVIRHYDVTGKLCPRPFIDDAAWAAFKRKVVKYYGQMQEKEKEGVREVKYYEKLEDIPAGEMRETVAGMINRGTVKGNSGGLHLSEDMVRMLVYLHREGVIK